MIKFIKKRLHHRCFPVNIANFLRTAILWNTFSGCFWIYFLHAVAVKLFKNSNIMEHLWCLLLDLFLGCGSSCLEIFCKRVVLRDFAKFTGKHKKKRKKRRWHIGFPVNFVKFIRSLFLTDCLQWLLLCISYPILYPSLTTSRDL